MSYSTRHMFIPLLYYIAIMLGEWTKKACCKFSNVCHKQKNNDVKKNALLQILYLKESISKNSEKRDCVSTRQET